MRKSFKTIFILVFILLVTFVSFSSTLDNPFLEIDDKAHVLQNPNVHSLSLSNIKDIFYDTRLGGYIPLTILSFAVEYHFFKDDPFMYHLNNLLLHCAIVGLIFWLALQLGLGVSAAGLAAFIFGVHPLHVESVAWITERKDVLYAFFYVLALCLYGRFHKTKNITFYGLSIICGLLSILAKPMGLSLPLILLLWDWFIQKEIKPKDILNKLPYVIVILPIIWKTVSVHARVPEIIPGQALLIGTWTLTFYLKKFLFPLVLVPNYQLPFPIHWANPEYGIAMVILLCSMVIVCRYHKNRLLVFSCLFYLLSIFFLLKLDRVDDFVVADRYMYLPSLGFCLLLGVLIDKLFKRSFSVGRLKRFIALLVVSSLAVLLCLKTYVQNDIWQDNLTLWNYVLHYYPGNEIAYNHRGDMFSILGRHDEAIRDFDKAITLNRKNFNAGNKKTPVYYNNRAIAHFHVGNYAKALKDTKLALLHDPNYVKAFSTRANVYLSTNQVELSLLDFNEALKLDPKDYESLVMRAVVYGQTGQLELALADLNRAITYYPQAIKAYNNRGTIYLIQKRYKEALADFNRTLRLDPDFADTYNNRAFLYMQQNNNELALYDLNRAIELNPQLQDAYYNRMRVHQARKDYSLALKDVNTILDKDKTLYKFIPIRASYYIKLNKHDEAMTDYNIYLLHVADDHRIYRERGKLFYMRKNYQRSLDDLNQSVKLNSKDGLTYFHRALTFFAMKDYERAWLDAQKANSLGAKVGNRFMSLLQSARYGNKQNK